MSYKYDLDYQFKFGKYKGKSVTLKWVIENDIDYVNWQVENNDSFILSDEADLYLIDQRKRNNRLENSYGLNDYIKFGKFSGALIKELILKQQSYIVWLLLENKTFELDKHALSFLEKVLKPELKAALVTRGIFLETNELTIDFDKVIK